jgi:NitT/TauT family transport system substrate-binding protein
MQRDVVLNTRRRALGILGGAASALVAPGILTQVTAQGLDRLALQLDWLAQPELGGFYQALATGLYKKHGIDADVRMGGPQQNPSALLLGGRADMIVANSVEAINYVREGLPFVCIAAIFQKDPAVIISHPGMGHDSLAALKGKPILVGAAARNSFWPFLKAKFGYSDDQLRPYTFNMAPFLADKNLSQQGFISSEPYAIEKEGGVKPVVHLIADAGYESYQTTINVSRKLAAEKADVVQRFMTATLEGWAEYIKGGAAAEPANMLIKKNNPDITDDKIAFALTVMNANGIVRSGDALKLGIGAMTEARWKRFYDQMAEVGVFPKGLDITKAYTLQFVNKGIGT